MDLRQGIAFLATTTSIAFFLTGTQACLKIWRQGSTSNVSFFPFLVVCFNNIFWCKYSILIDDFAFMVTCVVGVTSQLLYMMIYYMYTRDKKEIHMQCCCACLFVFPVLLYVKYFAPDQKTALYYLGCICCLCSVLSYGSPLISVAQVIKTKSTECMTFAMCFANFLVSFLWTTYGHLIGDNFVKFPNLLGFLLCVAQMSLFICYPKSSHRTLTYTRGSKPLTIL